MKIIVIGSSGNLATSLRILMPGLVFVSRHDNTLEILNLHKPKFIINCAAYTNVELAESVKDEAIKLNVDLPKQLAEWCLNNNCHLIHISTDYVFDGMKNTPYEETDITNPINFYGLTKKTGEDHIIATNCKYTIIRTSWLYGPFGKNFFKTILNLLKTKKEVKVVSDQFGTPTMSLNLADVILKITQQYNITGIYHYSDNYTTSWYEFARKISKAIGSGTIIPITSNEYITVANRPNYSSLSTNKINSIIPITNYTLEENIERVLNDYGNYCNI